MNPTLCKIGEELDSSFLFFFLTARAALCCHWPRARSHPGLLDWTSGRFVTEQFLFILKVFERPVCSC